MQPASVSTLDFTLTLDVPSTPEEFDQMAKRQGACIEEANNNIIYRSVLANFRELFTEALAEKTGIERKFEVVKPAQPASEGKEATEEVTRWTETEKVYAKRVWAELVARGDYPTPEAAQAAFAPLAAEVMAGIKFDPTASERQSAGPKKTPKTYVEIADSLIEMAGGVDAAVAAFSKKTGKSVEANRDKLAAAIWEDQKAQRKNIAAGYAG